MLLKFTKVFRKSINLNDSAIEKRKVKRQMIFPFDFLITNFAEIFKGSTLLSRK
jgi:hypothetical protein